MEYQLDMIFDFTADHGGKVPALLTVGIAYLDNRVLLAVHITKGDALPCFADNNLERLKGQDFVQVIPGAPL